MLAHRKGAILRHWTPGRVIVSLLQTNPNSLFRNTAVEYTTNIPQMYCFQKHIYYFHTACFITQYTVSFSAYTIFILHATPRCCHTDTLQPWHMQCAFQAPAHLLYLPPSAQEGWHVKHCRLVQQHSVPYTDRCCQAKSQTRVCNTINAPDSSVAEPWITKKIVLSYQLQDPRMMCYANYPCML
jgi:hypothetical protein